MLESGTIIGVDQGGIEYDGTYIFNPRTDNLDFELVLTATGPVALVTGRQVPAGAKIPAKASVPANLKKGDTVRLQVNVAGAAVGVELKCLREFGG